MSVRFHLDKHISGSIAVALRRHGIDVTTFAECGLAGADDETQFVFAASAERVIVTQDADFLRHHAKGMSHHLTHTVGKVGAMTRSLILILICCRAMKWLTKLSICKFHFITFLTIGI